MRLVLDTNVVASALLWGGIPRLLLQAGRVQRATLYTSPALLAELTDILGRRKFGKKIAASGFSVDELAPYETNTGYLCLIRNPNLNPQEE